jgi:hypothetical protein
MSNFASLSYSGAQKQTKLNLPKMPELPPEVISRFPAMAKWQKEMEDWRDQLVIAIRGQAN